MARPHSTQIKSSTIILPTPYILSPTGRWDGDDGTWSTFTIAVGSPPQPFRILPATTGDVILLPFPPGCSGQLLENVSDCGELRGVDFFEGIPSRGFQSNKSKTWDGAPDNPYLLDLERNLFINTAVYGTDTVTLKGATIDASNQSLTKQTVALITTADFWLGSLGLGISSTDLMPDSSTPSLLETLKAQNIIPSLAYGYTAGQSYQSPGVLGSLIFGGYDEARLAVDPIPINVPFDVTAAHGLRLTITSLTASNTLQGYALQQFIAYPITVNVDSAVSQLWLPSNICDKISSAFNLTYIEDGNYYIVNETTHRALKDNSPVFTFEVGSPSGASSIQITIPYSAFDLNLTLPLAINSIPYFPLRKAANSSQFTLGRAFLQEAYLVVNWENSTFTIGQAVAQDNYTHVISLENSESQPVAASYQNTRTAIIAGVVAVVIVAVAFVIAWWMVSRFYKRKSKVPTEGFKKKDLQERKELDSKQIIQMPGHAVVQLVGNHWNNRWSSLSDSCELEAGTTHVSVSSGTPTRTVSPLS
ncbi:hypothetical protein M433DRAFT_76677 [Acidomyces richmondensis BFW]|nr:hypothetical protein M433DRAFT_76677 [Acidomyces richmondensis BFW]